MIKKGTWSFHSKSDSRWNYEGEGYVGGFVMNEEAKNYLEKMKSILGAPPDDLEYEYMKY